MARSLDAIGGNVWRLQFSAIGIVCAKCEGAANFAAQHANESSRKRQRWRAFPADTMILETPMSKKVINPLTLTIGAALLGAVGMANAGSFAMNDLGPGYMLAGDKAAEGSCGEKKADGKCGEGSCGEKKADGSCGEKKADGKCGEGSCGEKKADGSCGEKKADGSCGEKKADGSCGEKKADGSCGEKKADGSCGEKKEH
jgi:uncharacterized low-complexity protein